VHGIRQKNSDAKQGSYILLSEGDFCDYLISLSLFRLIFCSIWELFLALRHGFPAIIIKKNQQRYDNQILKLVI
jgi:hypothetical protein